MGLLSSAVMGCGDDGGSMSSGTTDPGPSSGADFTSTGDTLTGGSTAVATTATGGPTSDDTSSTGSSSEGSTDGSADSSSTDTGDPSGCNADGGDADKPRYVVISRPYSEGGAQANTYEVLSLSSTGELAETGTTFEMGRAFNGEIVFTPSGRFGLVAQDDGSLGVLDIGDDGAVTVLQTGFTGAFFPERLVMDPSGDTVWVIDAQTADNGGGIRQLSIDCDGQLADQGLHLAGNLPYALAFADRGRAVVGALGLEAGGAPDANAFLIDWAAPSLLASAEAFAGEEPIISSLALTHDQRFGLLADNSLLNATHRIAVVEVLEDDGLAFVQEIGSLVDPFDIVTSPFDDAAVFVSGPPEDALFILDYDPDGATPFSIRGELGYAGPPPALPANMVMVERGALEGRVLVAENSSVRMFQFEGGGVVTGLGTLSFGSGLANIVGAIGVQP